jgi:hypothetical protein
MRVTRSGSGRKVRVLPCVGVPACVCASTQDRMKFRTRALGAPTDRPARACTHAELASGLLLTARSRLDSMQSLSAETRRRRLVAWLQRRGHGWDVITPLLRLLEL